MCHVIIARAVRPVLSRAQPYRAAMSQVPFYCLPAAVGLWFLPAPLRHLILYSSGLPFAETWRNPRAASKLRPNHDLLQRCEAVHANALEGLVFFFGSVLAAVVAGVPSEQVDTAAVTYVASRVAAGCVPGVLPEAQVAWPRAHAVLRGRLHPCAVPFLRCRRQEGVRWAVEHLPGHGAARLNSQGAQPGACMLINY